MKVLKKDFVIENDELSRCAPALRLSPRFRRPELRARRRLTVS